MTDEQINAAIAEACGWKPHRRSWKLSKGKNGHVLDYFETKEAAEEYLQICRRNTADWLNEFDVFEVAVKPPNYCTDLNAMNEAEETLTEEQWDVMFGYLVSIRWRNANDYERRGLGLQKRLSPSRATARQRAEAFLRTLGKWEEGE